MRKPAAKPNAAAAGASHPTYFEMIKEAIVPLKDRTGSSTVAIAKHIEEKHGASLPTNFRKFISVQLRASVSKGRLVKVKASYKLSDAAKDSPKAKRLTDKAKAKPKTTSSRAGKKAHQIIMNTVASLRDTTGMGSDDILTYIDEKHGSSLTEDVKEMLQLELGGSASNKKAAGPKRKAAEENAVGKAKVRPRAAR